jgi:hypothetical protein
MLPFLPSFSFGCYHLSAAPLTQHFIVDPDACFAFSNASVFAGVNLTITLNEISRKTFFGLDASPSKALPEIVFIAQGPIQKGEQVRYRDFNAAIPVLCSPHVEAADVSRIVFPEGVVTADGMEVTFEAEFVAKSEVYEEYFNGKSGNCIEVVRNIPEVHSDPIAVWATAMIGIGLVGLMLAFVGCIVRFTPKLVERAERDGEPVGLLRAVEVTNPIEIP